MSNTYYNASGNPGNRAFGSSAAIRAEFALIEDAFDKLPSIAGAGDALKQVRVNAGGTGFEVYDGETQFLALAAGQTRPLQDTLYFANTVVEGVRVRNALALLSGYNAAGSTRTGYVQFSAGGFVQLVAEAPATNGVAIVTPGGSISVNATGDATVTGEMAHAKSLRLAATAAITQAAAGAFSIGTDPGLAAGGVIQLTGSTNASPNRVKLITANTTRVEVGPTGETALGMALQANYRIAAAGTIMSQGGEAASGYGLRVLNAAGNGGGHITAPTGSNGGLRIGSDAGSLQLYGQSGPAPTITVFSTGITVSTNGNDNSNGVQVLSGSSTKYAGVSVGRSTAELILAVAGQTNNFFGGVAVGDSVLQATGALWIGNTNTSAIRLMANNTTQLFADANGVTDGAGLQLGYKGIPAALSGFTAGALPDNMNGRRTSMTGTITCSTGLTDGHTCTLINLSGSNKTLAAGSCTLIWMPSGVTGDRVIATNGWVTLLNIGSNTYLVTGVGIS